MLWRHTQPCNARFLHRNIGVKPTADWLIGMERRMRRDFKVLARFNSTKEAGKDAEVKTNLLKYLDDANKSKFERSAAADDQFKAGMGWLEVGWRGDPTGVPVFIGHVSWRAMLWDSQCERRDLTDARYMFRIKVVDADVALALFPHKRAEIERCIQTGDTHQLLNDWLGGVGALLSGLDAFNGPDDELDDARAVVPDGSRVAPRGPAAVHGVQAPARGVDAVELQPGRPRARLRPGRQ